MRALGHYLVHILSLDLKEQAVCVYVEEVTTLYILSVHLVIVKVIYKVFGKIQDTHPNVHWAIEGKTVCVDLDCRMSIIEDGCSDKGLADDNFPEVLHRLPKSCS